MDLSIVVPMYNESGVMDLFFQRIADLGPRMGKRVEVVCVNDGSRDETLLKLKERAAENPEIRVISLSRNFGKEAALTAGLAHARGRAVIPIDADLQDPPELIPEMAWIGMECSSKTWRTPTCARQRANPPPRASPIRTGPAASDRPL